MKLDLLVLFVLLLEIDVVDAYFLQGLHRAVELNILNPRRHAGSWLD